MKSHLQSWLTAWAWNFLCGIFHMFVLYFWCYGFIVEWQRVANGINICSSKVKSTFNVPTLHFALFV